MATPMAAPRKVCIIGYTTELTMKSSNGLLRIFVIVFLVIAYAAPLRALRFDARPPDERWSIITRYNYRVRINGRYLGHADREIRETYKMVSRSSRGARVSGWARVIGSTKRDGLPVAARLESSQSVDFFLADNGAVSDAEGRFPSLQGFPVFPDGEINRGDQWEAPIGVGILGPEGRGAVLQSIASYTYTGPAPYQGRDAHYFEVVWALRYQGCAGCRYSEDTLSGILNAVSGSHRVTLVVDDRTGAPVMARNSLRERWEWADSGTEEREGFALIFWKGVPPLDTQAIEQRFKSARLPAAPAPAAPLPRRTRPQPSSPAQSSPGPTSPDQPPSERPPSERPPAGRTPPDQSASAQSPTERPPAGRTPSAQPFSERPPGERTPSGRPPSDRSSAERTPSGRTASGQPPSDQPPSERTPAELPTSDGLTITPTPAGLSVTLHNLHFEPNTAVILPRDRPLLDEIAAVLSDIPSRTVVVRGHTADVGRPADQDALSEERAKTVADELSARGTVPGRLIFEGVGAAEPLDSNDTEAGRRRNRRVELLIVED